MQSRETPLERRNLSVRLHLPSFLQKSVAETRTLLDAVDDVTMDDAGWIEVRASGWALVEATRMQVSDLSQLPQ